MTLKVRGWALVLIAALGLSACQPPLRTELPEGPSAYEAVEMTQEMSEALNAQLRPGDELRISVFQEQDLSIDQTVIDQAGNVSLPLIGEMKAAGLSPAQLGREIELAYGARFLRDPHVTIILLEGAPRVVSIEGEVVRPGVYEIGNGQTLLTALALAGSPTVTAKLDEVLIFREVDGQRMGGRFDAVEIRSGRSTDPLLLPGDVVVVGFSSVRGLYQDFLRTAPLIGAFSRF